MNRGKSLYDLSGPEYIEQLKLYIENHRKELLSVASYDGSRDSLGHAGYHHSTISEEDLVIRNLHDGKATSTFESEEKINAYIADALLTCREKIKDWFLYDSSQSLCLRVRFKKDIGYGVDLNFKGKDTDTVFIKLKRSHGDYDELGFIITTAFPDIRSKTAHENGKDYLEKAEEIKGEPISRGELLKRAIKDEFRLFFERRNYPWAIGICEHDTAVRVFMPVTTTQEIHIKLSTRGESYALKTNGVIDNNYNYSDIFYNHEEAAKLVDTILTLASNVDDRLSGKKELSNDDYDDYDDCGEH